MPGFKMRVKLQVYLYRITLFGLTLRKEEGPAVGGIRDGQSEFDSLLAKMFIFSSPHRPCQGAHPASCTMFQRIPFPESKEVGK